MAKIVPSHMMDRNLFDFVGLKPTGVPDSNGDKAFDHEDPQVEPDDQAPKRNAIIPIHRATSLSQETD